jgi:internalin A
MKKILCLTLAILLALGLAACGAPAAQETASPTPAATEAPEVVVFTDPVLEAKVREIMGKPEGDITVAEAEAVTELVMNNEWPPPEEIITDISSLAAFKNLNKLELMFQSVTDISALAGLSKLQFLCLGGNQITDFSPLSGLTEMDSLQIWGNQASDLSPLSGMTKLKVLMIGGCPVTDISVVANFKELTILDITTCPVSDISSLAGLPLTTLNMNGCPITDYSPVADIYDSLQEKDFEILSADDIPDEPLVFEDPAFEKALRTAMGREDEEPITQKDAYLVQALEICNDKTEGSQFSDISPLAYFVNLKSLYFNSNLITDLAPLSGLTKLTNLDICFNQVADLSPLSGLTQLESLKLTNNQITDVSALSGMTNLWELWLKDNPVQDYSPLADIYPNLTSKDFELN